MPATTAALDTGHIVVTGPTTTTVTVAPGETKTVDKLDPGTYTVGLEGFTGGGVGFFTQITGVTVVAGQNATVTVPTFPQFRTAILSIPSYTVDGRFPLVFSKVLLAKSYVVQRSASPTFATSLDTSIAVTDTSVQVSIPVTGPYYVRVLAVDPYATRGQPSAAQSITTLTAVTVTPATPSIAAGATQQFTAAAKDAQNNPISGITFFWASSNQNVALVDQTGLATGVGGGSATISALGLGVPGSAALTVTGPVPTQLAFSSPPTSATAGASISPAVQVEVQDAGGNRITTARNAVTLAIGTNPGSGTLSGTLTANAVAGVATFSGLSIDKAGTGYTLTAGSGTLTGATSAAFDIAPGAPAQLAFTVQPTKTRLRAAVAPAVQVAIEDVFGNTVTGATNTVSLSLGVNPTGTTLSGATVGSPVNGVVSFSNLSVNETGAGYALTAVSGSLASATSNPFAVTFELWALNFTAGTITVVETGTNAVLATIPGVTNPHAVAFTPDGSRAYVSNRGSNTVFVISTTSRTLVTTVVVGASPFGLAITPDGARVYVANNGANTVAVINTTTNALLTTIPLPAGSTGPLGVAVTPDGASVYVTNNTSNNVSVISTASNTVVATVAVGNNPNDLGISPDGAVVYVTNAATNNVSVISTSSNTVLTTFAAGAVPLGVAFTPDGTSAYIAHFNSGNVAVVSTAGPAIVAWLAAGANASKVAISPGGAFAYVTIFGLNKVAVISTATNRVIATIAVGNGPFGIGIPRSP